MLNSNYARSALFVDFDNIYITLRQQEGLPTADEFAQNPHRWLQWLENEMSLDHLGDGFLFRRILIRKCYINPAAFPNFRPFFTRAAFEVIDCPPLTQGGKTSSDIHMVMDIMDALHMPTHFDEFILLSADADFTPVLLRVRLHDRRSTVLAAGFPSPAYRSACDYLPSMSLFLQQALGLGQPEDENGRENGVPNPTPEQVLDHLAEVLEQKVGVNGIIYADELPALYKRVDEFRESTTWLDFRSLRRLTKAVVDRRPEWSIVEDLEEGSWGIRVRISAFPLPEIATTSKTGVTTAIPLAENAQPDHLRPQIARLVVEEVRHSTKPVVMAVLASTVMERFGNELAASGWLGAHSFKGLLEQLDLDGLKLNNQIPGYVYDPLQHNLAALGSKALAEDRKTRLREEFARKYAELEPLAWQIHQITDMPYLLPEHYALILGQIARAVNESGFQGPETVRLVRERCVERGVPVAHGQINFIVGGIYYGGHPLGQPGTEETPEALVEPLCANVFNLCQSAQWTLAEDEKLLVRSWFPI